MLVLAQISPAEQFFPPWWFWLFVFGIVLVIFGAIATMVVASIWSDHARQIRERELAAQLIELLLEKHKLSADEVEQILNAYWRIGTFWGRFQPLWNRFFGRGAVSGPPKFPDSAFAHDKP